MFSEGGPEVSPLLNGHGEQVKEGTAGHRSKNCLEKSNSGTVKTCKETQRSQIRKKNNNNNMSTKRE